MGYHVELSVPRPGGGCPQNSCGEHVRMAVLELLPCQQAGVQVVLQMGQIPQTADHRGRVPLVMVVSGKAQGLWFRRK